jgi:hypothetical protein
VDDEDNPSYVSDVEGAADYQDDVTEVEVLQSAEESIELRPFQPLPAFASSPTILLTVHNGPETDVSM